MESTGSQKHTPGSDEAGEGAPLPANESAPGNKRISITGLDQQSAEALQMAVTRLARRYGVEVRTEVSEDPPRPRK
jgi:hypothetical protein